MNLIKHIYYAVFYGEWSCGWRQYEGKPQWGLYTGYYDGHMACFHLYKLWIGVEY